MERTVDNRLFDLREDLLLMGGRAEEMIRRAVNSLLRRDSDLAARVIAEDDEIDDLEKRIDEEVTDLLVRQQPMATDMRFLIAAMKITSDLERIGDSAVNIAKFARVINDSPPVKPYVDLPKMAETVREMVQSSLNAFVQRDTGRARAVIERDQEVDELHDAIFDELQGLMEKDASLAAPGLALTFVIRNLERIADHATNISEDVIYFVEGEDVRHPTS